MIFFSAREWEELCYSHKLLLECPPSSLVRKASKIQSQEVMPHFYSRCETSCRFWLVQMSPFKELIAGARECPAVAAGSVSPAHPVVLAVLAEQARLLHPVSVSPIPQR